MLSEYNARMAISDDDLRACVRVLRTIEADRSHRLAHRSSARSLYPLR